MTNNAATAELVKYNASVRGKLVTHLTWEQIPQLSEQYTEVLVEMPEPFVDFAKLSSFDAEGVNVRIISDFEMLPNMLKEAEVTFLKRPCIPISAYFGDDSKAA